MTGLGYIAAGTAALLSIQAVKFIAAFRVRKIAPKRTGFEGWSKREIRDLRRSIFSGVIRRMR